ncbi:type 1 fimbrial protein [Escherichia coli]
MKNIATIAFLLSLGVAGSASAATSGDTIGTGSMAISQSLTASTCSVTFPSDVTLPSFSTATFNDASVNANLVDATSVGDITFSGCSGESVNIALTSSNNVSSSGYIYPTINGNSQSRVGYWIKVNGVGGRPNTTVSSLQNMSIDSDSYTVPVVIQTIKMSNLAYSTSTTGEYAATVTYTATYS